MIPIPKHFRGKSPEGAIEAALAEKARQEEEIAAAKAVQRPKLHATIDRSLYIWLPECDIVIANHPVTTPAQWDEVDAFLRRSNLYMPSVKEFLTFYTALRDASQEKITLKDADGKDIPHEVSKNLWFGLVKSEDTLEYALWLDTEWKRNDRRRSRTSIEYGSNHEGVRKRVVFPPVAFWNEKGVVRFDERNYQGMPTGPASTDDDYLEKGISYYPPSLTTDGCRRVAQFKRNPLTGFIPRLDCDCPAEGGGVFHANQTMPIAVIIPS